MKDAKLTCGYCHKEVTRAEFEKNFSELGCVHSECHERYVRIKKGEPKTFKSRQCNNKLNNMEEKETFVCIEMEGTKVHFPDLDEAFACIKDELNGLVEEDLIKFKFKLSFEEVSSEEIENWPQFEGF